MNAATNRDKKLGRCRVLGEAAGARVGPTGCVSDPFQPQRGTVAGVWRPAAHSGARTSWARCC